MWLKHTFGVSSRYDDIVHPCILLKVVDSGFKVFDVFFFFNGFLQYLHCQQQRCDFILEFGGTCNVSLDFDQLLFDFSHFGIVLTFLAGVAS